MDSQTPAADGRLLSCLALMVREGAEDFLSGETTWESHRYPIPSLQGPIDQLLLTPDLRYLPAGQEGDEIFLQRIRHGATRDGRVYMPPFEGILSQEAMWAIRAWLETVRED